jgi:HD superfamily phosphodiesterase
MTIDQALDLLTTAKEGWPLNDNERYYQALELGIEALSRYKALRKHHFTGTAALLPGETEE